MKNLLDTLLCPILFPLMFPIGLIIALPITGLYCIWHHDTYREISYGQYEVVQEWVEHKSDLKPIVEKYARDGKISMWEYNDLEARRSEMIQNEGYREMMDGIRKEKTDD